MRKSVHLVGYSDVYVEAICRGLVCGFASFALPPRNIWAVDLYVSLSEFPSSHGWIMICNG